MGFGPYESVGTASSGHCASAAAGKNESVSLSLFIEVNVLEFEEDLSTSGHALLGRGGWDEHLGKRTAEGVEEAGP